VRLLPRPAPSPAAHTSSPPRPLPPIADRAEWEFGFVVGRILQLRRPIVRDFSPPPKRTLPDREQLVPIPRLRIPREAQTTVPPLALTARVPRRPPYRAGEKAAPAAVEAALCVRKVAPSALPPL
jgi:hypothetical protein